MKRLWKHQQQEKKSRQRENEGTFFFLSPSLLQISVCFVVFLFLLGLLQQQQQLFHLLKDSGLYTAIAVAVVVVVYIAATDPIGDIIIVAHSTHVHLMAFHATQLYILKSVYIELVHREEEEKGGL